jgi:hypothetical protein
MANLVALDLSRFSRGDIAKMEKLGEKQRLLYRWFRLERNTEPGLDQCVMYSGARGYSPYAAYRVARHRDGRYELFDQRSSNSIIEGRTINSALEALPEDFYYSHSRARPRHG